MFTGIGRRGREREAVGSGCERASVEGELQLEESESSSTMDGSEEESTAGSSTGSDAIDGGEVREGGERRRERRREGKGEGGREGGREGTRKGRKE